MAQGQPRDTCWLAIQMVHPEAGCGLIARHSSAQHTPQGCTNLWKVHSEKVLTWVQSAPSPSRWGMEHVVHLPHSSGHPSYGWLGSHVAYCGVVTYRHPGAAHLEQSVSGHSRCVASFCPSDCSQFQISKLVITGMFWWFTTPSLSENFTNEAAATVVWYEV